ALFWYAEALSACFRQPLHCKEQSAFWYAEALSSLQCSDLAVEQHYWSITARWSFKADLSNW
ncbi:MAG TPA: hypothetical protein PKK16_02450, partial [Bacteroidales bacterium]|nr:hypothetical protein [Bacteroidales bacterium]HPH80870.1 hypothetical protein [Bacteroidales bacterium]